MRIESNIFTEDKWITVLHKHSQSFDCIKETNILDIQYSLKTFLLRLVFAFIRTNLQKSTSYNPKEYWGDMNMLTMLQPEKP